MLPVTNYHETTHDYYYLFFFPFFADAKAVQEITESSFCLSANVLAKHLDTMQYFLNIKYMYACISYNVTQKITSFKRMTSPGGRGRGEWEGGLRGAQS